jgi:hypothetical protein
MASVVGSSDAVVAEAIVRPHIDKEESVEGARLKALRKQREGLLLERQILDQDLQRLRRLEVRSRPSLKDGEPPHSVSVEPRLTLVRFRTDEMEKTRQRRREVEKLIADLKDEEESLERTSRRECRVSKRVELLLQGSEPLKSDSVLVLSYRVPGARWTPAYQLKFDPLLSQVQAQLRVLVAQDTGEDWGAVTLSVTTADAGQCNQLKELTSVRIGKSQPAPPASEWKAPPSDTLSLFSDFDRRLSEEGGFVPQEIIVPELPAPKPHVSKVRGLSENQKWAILLMSVEPEYSAEVFSHWSPERVQEITHEITQLPTVSTEVREYVLAEFRDRGILSSDDRVHVQTMARGAQDAGEPTRVLAAGPPNRMEARITSAPVKKRKRKSRIPTSTIASFSIADRCIPPASGGSAMVNDLMMLKEETPTEVRIPDPSTREYARLVMPSALQKFRGRLQVQSLTEQIRKVAIRAGLDAEELVGQVRKSIQRAERVGSMSWPSGHSGPRWPGEEPFDLHFESQGLCRVPSDGAFHGQLLKEFTLPVTSRFVTVPRETQQVFRSVEMESPDVLPPGQADIYVGGDFLLSGPVDGAAPGGKLRLALGVEEQIKVARNTRFAESVSGVVSKTRRFEHTLEIELANNLSREATIEVRERLPQPAELEKDVEVKVDSSKPEWESFEPDDSSGIADARRWVVGLKAGQKATLEARYTIIVPKKFELQGGNRRD